MKYGKVIGRGNTATVYELEEAKVLKLFNQGYPRESVEKEFNNSRAISNMDFIKPKAYEIVFLEERIGIIYDKIEGESLLDWVMRTGDVQSCAVYMASLHKAILQNSISNVPSYKEFLKYNIINALSENQNKQKEALNMLDKLQDGITLCHGDFHPGNIFVSDGQAMVIDFMNVCHGDFLYDIARTVYLVEYTPVPVEVKEREMLLRFKKTLADLYLIEMNVTREMIQDYLSVITMARAGECPNE
ncbi:aminoglycoside phosphotransferase family protein [Tissierella sp. MB52-C2]|uniref:aminoglycoside phosphotransferase family protein n=1 Tax=Tissierella sp. MB52-C2 TaxID=3070999 RepID=UPI00280AA0B7|nr:aminoglycoside phosphotransferase family protein [Tissierella sp. MB52-C2]WMM23941.1 aminoglycoside phosphotransferase family protein [Tissierella sp. MB52-C2]